MDCDLSCVEYEIKRAARVCMEIAKEYVKTIDYADVSPAFDDLTDEDIERWKDGCEEYLSSDHKGADAY